MSLFLDIRFPEKISYYAIGGVEFFTIVQQAKNGTESRIILNPSGRLKYSLSNLPKSRAEVDELIAFFRLAKGRGHSFRFRDHSDFIALNQVLIPYLDEWEGHKFQLCKRYSVKEADFMRVIAKPVPGRLKIYENGNLLSPEEMPEVDYNSGLLTFKTPQLAESLRASFEFDVEVRFNTDFIEIKHEDYGVSSLQNLEIIEVI